MAPSAPSTCRPTSTSGSSASTGATHAAADCYSTPCSATQSPRHQSAPRCSAKPAAAAPRRHHRPGYKDCYQPVHRAPRPALAAAAPSRPLHALGVPTWRPPFAPFASRFIGPRAVLTPQRVSLSRIRAARRSSGSFGPTLLGEPFSPLMAAGCQQPRRPGVRGPIGDAVTTTPRSFWLLFFGCHGVPAGVA